MAYLETAHAVYKEAAINPQKGLCCTTTPVWELPGLDIPVKMLEMNYGCGSTIHPRDLVRDPTVLYVGVGGGMEVLVLYADQTSITLRYTREDSAGSRGYTVYITSICTR